MHAFTGRQAHFTPASDDTVVAQHGEITGVEERGNTVLVDLLLESGDVRNGVIFVTGEDDVPAGAYAIPGFADKVESAIVDGLGGLLGSIEKAIDGVESKVGTLIGHAVAEVAGQRAAVEGTVIGVDHDTTIASVTDETVAADANNAAAKAAE